MPYMPDGMPLPVPTIDTKGFWDAAKRHELVIQRCLNCGTFRHTPIACCHVCQSFEYEWHRVSGKGIVYSYIICNHPVHPVLESRVPYNVVAVELPDAGNVRVSGNLLDCPEQEIYIGMPVEVTWEDIDDEVTLPQWKKATP
ncbi:MAG: OB-fold domain-containing protein [Desulfatiglans sp.]|jgi:uncharacterized OB-fold protein|nr:OB-fold domain-containing protein [Desulfatiglans sp.]